ncbi:MAG: OmpA family protein [Saprospiraceae bacterium]
MRVFTFGFLVFLVFALSTRWFYVCEIKHQCGDQPVETRPMTLSFKDGDQTILQGYEQFGFQADSIEADISPNNQIFLEKIAAYLKQNPDRKITLTGRFLESEKTANAGMFENIGIARAAFIELQLEKLGIDEKRISIDYEMASGSTMAEPMSFALQSERPDNYEKLEYRFEDNTFSDANFAFGSADFKPGEACILYADSVKNYLAINTEKMLSIIGHTDSIDTEKYNYNLGLKRAESAAQYFRELGVKAEIKTSSMGELQPVAPNSKPDGSDNPDGRQKNRRVNFKIIDSVLE